MWKIIEKLVCLMGFSTVMMTRLLAILLLKLNFRLVLNLTLLFA